MAYKDKVEHVPKDTLLMVGTGVVESTRVKAKRPEVSVKVLRDRKRFMGVDLSCVDNM